MTCMEQHKEQQQHSGHETIPQGSILPEAIKETFSGNTSSQPLFKFFQLISE